MTAAGKVVTLPLNLLMEADSEAAAHTCTPAGSSNEGC